MSQNPSVPVVWLSHHPAFPSLLLWTILYIFIIIILWFSIHPCSHLSVWKGLKYYWIDLQNTSSIILLILIPQVGGNSSKEPVTCQRQQREQGQGWKKVRAENGWHQPHHQPPAIPQSVKQHGAALPQLLETHDELSSLKVLLATSVCKHFPGKGKIVYQTDNIGGCCCEQTRRCIFTPAK